MGIYAPTNNDVLNEFNKANGISITQRDNVLELLRQKAPETVSKLISRYFASMGQDREPGWLAQRPSQPEIIPGAVPETADEVVDILGIGGMFAYLNVLYQAHKNGGRHCIVTNPHDIFTFSGWTLHPEEDMDQRLIEMFQTKFLFLNEAKRILGFSDEPRSIRYKSFRIDYRNMLAQVKANPGELIKNLKVALQYTALEFTDAEKRYARANLERNAATIDALKQMGRIGNDPGRDIVNMCGRVVFEVEGEAGVEWKNRLKEQFGLVGKRLTPSEVRAIYGADIKIIDDMNAGRITAFQYPGGHFLTGYRQNALEAAQAKNVLVYDNAVATKIIVDRQAGKHAVSIRLAEGEERTVIADVLLVALGDYADNVITVDGISTLFVIVTDNDRYRIHPTGMGEGGTIHVVPVWSVQSLEKGEKLYYHLGKATNGAIMGRNPGRHKSLYSDRGFLTHLEAHLKRIAAPHSTFVWLAATECGRPVSAKQGYSVHPLRTAKRRGKGSSPHMPMSFKATGGCGLGGNTAIIPEVQKILDRRAAEG